MKGKTSMKAKRHAIVTFIAIFVMVLLVNYDSIAGCVCNINNRTPEDPELQDCLYINLPECDETYDSLGCYYLECTFTNAAILCPWGIVPFDINDCRTDDGNVCGVFLSDCN